MIVVVVVRALDFKVGALDFGVGALDSRVGALDFGVGALDFRARALDSRVGALDFGVGPYGPILDIRVGVLDRCTKDENLQAQIKRSRKQEKFANHFQV